jgi:hypothetical protein
MEIVEENDKVIVAKYENCKIYMHLTDFLGIKKKYLHFQFDDNRIIYLKSFECDMQQRKKGNGRILLGLMLEYIKNTRFKSENIFVSLVVAGNNRIDESGIVIKSDDTKLVQYYNKLGFSLINNDIDIMIGRLPIILIKCTRYSAGKTSRRRRLQRK